MSDGPALEGGTGLALDLNELVLLGLGRLDVGHLRPGERGRRSSR